MITTDLRAAYAPQTVYSPTRLPIRMPVAPTNPTAPAPPLPTQSPYPGRVYTAQPAPVTPPVTTPASADVMAPSRTFSLPGYNYARPQAPPNPSGASTRWTTETMPTANEPTAEFPEGQVPPGSLEAELEAQAAPWYKRPLPLVGLTIGGGIAIVGAILLLRK